jgi:O-antigen/teichoic acid export membrane protein
MSKIKRFIGETLIYGFGNVFSRIFAMLLIPLYAEYLGKIDYSNLIMLQSVFTILTFLLALNAGVFYYYYEYENLKYKKIVFTTWFYYQLSMATIIVVVMYFASNHLFQLFVINEDNSSVIKICLVLVAIQLFPYIFNATNMNYFRIDRQPKKVVQIVLLEAAFTIVLVFISLSILKLGLIAVLISQIIARSFVSIFFINYAKIYIQIKFFSKKLLKKVYKYTWPFILSSIFTWVIISIDKFIGASELTDKSDVAILALGMQLVLPISVLADMIRMAVGPYVMSIRKESDAEKSYQEVFDLVVFASSFVLILIVLASPYLTLILADSTYMSVIYLIPLLAFAKLLSMAGNQFSIGFTLVKKNTFILFSIIIAGVIGVLVNVFFMKEYGYIISGISQILSYLAMSIFLFITGKKYANQKIKLINSSIITAIVLVFMVGFYLLESYLVKSYFIGLVSYSTVFLVLISFVFIRQQRLNLITLIKSLLNRKK